MKTFSGKEKKNPWYEDFCSDEFMHTFTNAHSQAHEIHFLLPRVPAPFLGGFYILFFILTLFLVIFPLIYIYSMNEMEKHFS